MFKRFLFAALVSTCLASVASAEIKLHPLFSEGMVFQQGAPGLRSEGHYAGDPGRRSRSF